MNKINYWLWGLAEKADWYNWFPKKFWKALLRYYDKKAGFGKDEITPEGPSGSSENVQPSPDS